MSFFISSKSITVVALGLGFVIGAVGYLVHDLYFAKKRRLLQTTEALSTQTESEAESSQPNASSSFNGEQKSNSYSDVDIDRDMSSDSLVEYYSLSDEESFSLADDREYSTVNRFNEIDRLLDSEATDVKMAYDTLLDFCYEDKNDPEVFWRVAKACHILAIEFESKENITEMEKYINKGVWYAEKCIKLAPRLSDAHKWYAICIGARGDKLQGLKGKISDGQEFAKHLKQALQIKPLDPTLHHLYGRLHYEVASLSWFEKKFASSFLSEMPMGTYQEAIESLTKAENLTSKPWKQNKLLLAKCYIKLEDTSNARLWLIRAKNVETITREVMNAQNMYIIDLPQQEKTTDMRVTFHYIHNPRRPFDILYSHEIDRSANTKVESNSVSKYK